VNPSDDTLARRIGLTLAADRSAYTPVNSGGAPAGLAAAIHAPGPSHVEMLPPGSRSYAMRLLPAGLSARRVMPVPHVRDHLDTDLRGRGGFCTIRRRTP
jgi:hypothetical protein